MFNRQKGFTLIELLVVIAIIGLLSSVVLASLSSARSKSRDSQRVSTLIQLRTALELYYSKHGSYPSTVGGTIYSSDVDPTGLFGGTNGGNWIPGLVADKDIAVLPHDPRPGVPTGCDPGGVWWGGATTPQSVYASYNGSGYILGSICGMENAITAGNTFFDKWLESNVFSDFHTLKMCVNGDTLSNECNGGAWGYF